jgi:transcriptional regulator with XRE-family HTH domain
VEHNAFHGNSQGKSCETPRRCVTIVGQQGIFIVDIEVEREEFAGASSSQDGFRAVTEFENRDQEVGFSEALRAKSALRLKYEAETEIIRRKLGDLEAIRSQLGLSQRKMAQLLLVDPSAWTRWTKGGEKAPPHVYRMLQWYLALEEKYPALDVNFWLSTVAQVSSDSKIPEISAKVNAAETRMENFEERFESFESRIEQMMQKTSDSFWAGLNDRDRQLRKLLGFTLVSFLILSLAMCTLVWLALR